MFDSDTKQRLGTTVRILVVGAFLVSLSYSVGASFRLFSTTLSAWARSVAVTVVLFVLAVAVVLDAYLDR